MKEDKGQWISGRKKFKHPRVFIRKLGREGYPFANCMDEGRRKTVEIDPRQKGIELLDTFIHERLHIIFPGLTEESKDYDNPGIHETAVMLSDWLWKLKYRRVDES